MVSRLAQRLYRSSMPQPAPGTRKGNVQLLHFFNFGITTDVYEFEYPLRVIRQYNSARHNIYMLTICRIRLRKESEPPYHEGLTLDIALPNGTLCGYVTLDRYSPEMSGSSVAKSAPWFKFHRFQSLECPQPIPCSDAFDKIVLYNIVNPLPAILTKSVHTIDNLTIPLARAFAAADAVHHRWVWTLSKQSHFYALCVACLLLSDSEWDAQLPALKAIGAGSDLRSLVPIVPLDTVKTDARETQEMFSRFYDAIGDQILRRMICLDQKTYQAQKRRHSQEIRQIREGIRQAQEEPCQVQEGTRGVQEGTREVQEGIRHAQEGPRDAREELRQAQEEARRYQRQYEQLKAALEAAGVAVPDTN